jgi:hypothetical protein
VLFRSRCILRKGQHIPDLQKDWDRDGEEAFSFEWLERYASKSKTRQELEVQEELHLTGELYNCSKHARGGWKQKEITRIRRSLAALRVAKDPVERKCRSEQAIKQHKEGRFGRKVRRFP